MTDKPIIHCTGVHKWFGDFHALRGIDLDVYEGEVIVIFGPSGSGKSTFIRTINRLEEHQQGEIIVDGIELSHDVRNIELIRMETGMVFQQFNLFPHLSVMQNITLAPIWVRNLPKEEAEEKAIELLNTPNLKSEFQKRRRKMLTDKIDVTAFMVWFIENYPKSFKIMKDNPEYQYKFK